MEKVTPCFFGTRKDNMYAATFEITNRCNLACKHCMNESDSSAFEGMTLEQIVDLISEMYECGVRSLYITGGEALSHPSFEQIVEFAYNKGIKITLATNGFDLSKHIEIIKKYIYDISVSIDGIGETNDIFRNKVGLFDKIFTSIKKMKDHNVRIITSTVIWKGNKDQIEDIINFVRKIGVAQINFAFLVPLGRAVDPKLHLDPEDYFPVIASMEKLKAKYENDNFHLLFRRSYPIDASSLDCEGGSKILHVNAQGRVFPCSWCGKIGLDDMLSSQWTGGNLKECIQKIYSLNSIVSERKEKLGYSGCPAMAYAYYKELYADDPLNLLLKREEEN
jgi:MoaA/NifB/PqqE/SkfB family radical SAM enzyme